MKRFMGCAMVSVLLLGGLSACSDDDKTADTTVAVVATEAPADTAAAETVAADTVVADESAAADTAAADTAAADTVAADAPAGGDDAVAKFCSQADDLAAKFKEVMADPTKGDVAALSAQAQELSATAATLSGSNAEQAQKVSECAQKMSAAMVPGA